MYADLVVYFINRRLQPSSPSYYKQEEKERREDEHPGLGGYRDLGPPEWQPIMLPTTPGVVHHARSPLHILIFLSIALHNSIQIFPLS